MPSSLKERLSDLLTHLWLLPASTSAEGNCRLVTVEALCPFRPQIVGVAIFLLSNVFDAQNSNGMADTFTKDGRVVAAYDVYFTRPPGQVCTITESNMLSMCSFVFICSRPV